MPKTSHPVINNLPLCQVQVLRFFGYFQESVNESNMENHRIRKVILYYYLEDDSMHVAEPRQDNSGIPQASAVTSIAGCLQSLISWLCVSEVLGCCTRKSVGVILQQS